MPLYTVRLPDGSTNTRRSDRVYTHAIVVDSRPWGDESQGVWVLGYAGNEDLGRKRIKSLREGRSKEARRLEGAKFTLVPVEKISNPGGEVMTKRKNPITLSAEDYDALRPKDRIFLKTSGGFSAGEREFEVGRKSYSKKYKVESKRLYPVVRGEPVRRGIAKWTLYKRDNGRVSLAHGDMATIIYEFRRAPADNPDRDPYRRGPRVHVHHTFFQGPLDRAGGDGTYTKAVKAARRLAKKLKKTIYVDARGNEWIVWSYGKPSDPSAATFFGSRYHETAVEPPRANNPSTPTGITESELTKRLKF